MNLPPQYAEYPATISTLAGEVIKLMARVGHEMNNAADRTNQQLVAEATTHISAQLAMLSILTINLQGERANGMAAQLAAFEIFDVNANTSPINTAFESETVADDIAARLNLAHHKLGRHESLAAAEAVRGAAAWHARLGMLLISLQNQIAADLAP